MLQCFALGVRLSLTGTDTPIAGREVRLEYAKEPGGVGSKLVLLIEGDEYI